MFESLLSDAKSFIFLVILALILTLVDSLGFLNLPKSFVQYITTPIQYGLYKTSNNVIKQFDFIILARRAAQENKALKEQLAQILSDNAQLKKKLAETEGFLNQQNALNPQTFTLAAARPVGITRYLLIDKGSDDGLKINQAVIYKDNFIGKIKEVSPKKASVMLTTDPDSKISAYISSNEGRAKGVLLGQFGSEILFDKILHEEPVKVGDLVYTEGTEVEIPRGLVLGQVFEVNSNDNGVFKQAKVKSVFDTSDLDVVFVITN